MNPCSPVVHWRFGGAWFHFRVKEKVKRVSSKKQAANRASTLQTAVICSPKRRWATEGQGVAFYKIVLIIVIRIKASNSMSWIIYGESKGWKKNPCNIFDAFLMFWLFTGNSIRRNTPPPLTQMNGLSGQFATLRSLISLAHHTRKPSPPTFPPLAIVWLSFTGNELRARHRLRYVGACRWACLHPTQCNSTAFSVT